MDTASLDTALAIFCKEPIAGSVKTRLGAATSPEFAAALYEAFLRDTLQMAGQCTGLRPSLWHAASACTPKTLVELAHASSMTLHPQHPGDLGERILDAVHQLAKRSPCDGVVVIGSDAPTLPHTYVQKAASALRAGHRAVLGPSCDGGYYLIALATPVAADLRGVRWSSRYALEDTRRRLNARGADVVQLPPWYDIDTAADLRLLALHLGLDPRVASATRVALSAARPRTSSTNSFSRDLAFGF